MKGLDIIRTIEVEVPDKKGATKREKRHRLFHVKVNNGVTSDHRMVKEEQGAVDAYKAYRINEEDTEVSGS